MEEKHWSEDYFRLPMTLRNLARVGFQIWNWKKKNFDLENLSESFLPFPNKN